MPTLDVDFVRSQFPAFQEQVSREWAHLENAGGSYVPRQVIDRLNHFYTATKVQPYWDFEPSRQAGEAMDEAKLRLPATFNADPDEVHFGPSTTQNTYVLSNAIGAQLKNGDEVIVTNQDHEANVGAWRHLGHNGIVVKEWSVDSATGLLALEDLENLLTERTALVAVTHCSNVAATVNPVAEITSMCEDLGALVVVDGVSFAPHNSIDVAELGCDIYLYSAYKTYGPHIGLMYMKRALAEGLPNQGHYFNDSDLTTKAVPAGPNHAEIGAAAGIMSYHDAVHRHHFDAAPQDDVQLVREVFDLYGRHEQELMAPLVTYVQGHPALRLVGSESLDRTDRAPTIAFHSPHVASRSIYDALIGSQVSCGHGHFYAHRLVKALGLDPEDGVVRLSMVHYNTSAEVERAIEVLDETLQGR